MTSEEDDGEAAAHDTQADSSTSARLHEDIASLVYVSWEQAEPATTWVEYRPVDEEWRKTPATERDAGFHEQLLLGIPFATQVEYRVVYQVDKAEVSDTTGTITTGSLPESLPEIERIGADENAWDPTIGFFLASTNQEGTNYEGPWWTVILDRQGRYVWAWPTEFFRVSVYVQPTYDGTGLLIDQNSFWSTFDMGAGSQVLEVSIEGEVWSTLDTPRLHHPFTQTEDETLVWAAIGVEDTDNETLEALSPDGVQTRIWDCADFHAETGLSSQCSGNTLTWDPATDRFLLSLWSTETVVEIDRSTGATPRWFGHAPGSWGFSPEESIFWWQHGAVYTTDHTLLISTTNEEGGDETWVREYRLDETTETLEQVWSFGEGEGVYSESMSGAHRFSGGNTLHNYGSTPRLREVTPTGDVVWEISLGKSSYLGLVTPLADLYTFVH